VLIGSNVLFSPRLRVSAVNPRIASPRLLPQSLLPHLYGFLLFSARAMITITRDGCDLGDHARFDLYLLVSLAASGGADKPPSARI
jgi:hypothetical protein